MRRRSLLATGATVLAGLAGCVADGSPGTSDDPTVTEATVETTDTGCGTGDYAATIDRDETAGTVRLTGALSASNPCHEATVETATIEDGRLVVRLGTRSTAAACVTCVGRIEFAATVTVDGPVPDRVSVTGPGLTARTTPDGTEGTSVTDAEETPEDADRTPEPTTEDGTDEGDGDTPTRPTRTSIETTDTGCAGGAGFDATVAVEDGRVTVAGAAEAPNPCHEATLADVRYDGSADVLVVSVDVQSTGGICTQCVGRIEYEAVVEYDGDRPGTVRVDAPGGSTTVES
ncbi:hypothetical protein BRD17_05415 [Halobacteriales archaeon SW_7_68_16]|nr:MAG: hypothetical protein BRD17_05415 [Halobacteriales archaeon SW_7_68_16]